MIELSVYNLVFPDHIHILKIAGYKFRRIENYPEAFARLQQTINVSGGEFPIIPNTGSHQITALVEIPDTEERAILPWISSNFTKLQDVLLLLSLFTRRNVFALKKDEEAKPLFPDPRQHFRGGQFRLSKLEDSKYKHKETGELKSLEEMKNIPVFDYNLIDLGFEKTINELLNTIASNEWRKDYGNGYFIFTFRQALKQEDIEPAFLLCWTIWEHLFALHNRQWLDQKSIEKTSGDKKIAFILNKYLLIDFDGSARTEVRRITTARNSLVHFGTIPDSVDYDEMRMFMSLTEQIMAIILRLKPSNAFNTIERLKSFLSGQRGDSAL